MVKVEFKSGVIPSLVKYTIIAGWINTGEHPGYEGRKPSGATIAEVAAYNRREDTNYERDFTVPFREYMLEWLPDYLKADIKESFASKTFISDTVRLFLTQALIAAIKEHPWPANSPAWLAFKEKHGLSLSPLIASQIMLDSIKAEVVE